MATTYTVRVVEEDGIPIAYIDANGSAVIRQHHAPGAQDDAPWDSMELAKEWADAHAKDLSDYSIAGDKAREETERQQAEQDALLLQAKEDSKKIAELYDMVKALSADKT